jgi:hypothetical protein
MTSGGGDGSTRAKEDGVGLDIDPLYLLDVVDALDESVDPPVTRLDPVQVAGIYGTRFNSTIKDLFTYLELTLSSHLAWTDTPQSLHVFPSLLRPQIEA